MPLRPLAAFVKRMKSHFALLSYMPIFFCTTQSSRILGQMPVSAVMQLCAFIPVRRHFVPNPFARPRKTRILQLSSYNAVIFNFISSEENEEGWKK